jgi:hypothetical protein
MEEKAAQIIAPVASLPASTSSEPVAKPKRNWLLVIVLAICLVIGLSAGGYYLFANKSTTPQKKLPTYFSYSDSELTKLSSLQASGEITKEDLYKWDEKTFEVIKENKLGDVFVGRIFAYLHTAQKDFASLSFNIHGKYVGSIDQVSKEVLCEFVVASCSGLSDSQDPYSKEISKLIMTKVKERIASDKAQNRKYEVKAGADFWKGTEPFYAQEVGSWKPWFISSASEFRALPPPAYDSDEFKTQIAHIQAAKGNITDKQKEAVIAWAGGPGTVTPPGLWIKITDEYMQEKNSDLATVLLVHESVSQAMMDSIISVFDSKYTYLRKRPFMLLSNWVTIMPTPNHPSYPAAHGTISYSAATVLNHFFPENKANFLAFAEEATNCREWGGIHFMVDNQSGATMGTMVVEKLISSLNKY